MTTKRNERPSLDELSPRRPGRGLSPQKPPQEKKHVPTTQEIETNLKESLESTDEGLKKFLASLRQAGMPEAVQAYRAMQMVLVQQRLWTHQHRHDQLLPSFRSIARTTGEIHKIFASFADVMKPLKEIDKIRGTLMVPEPDKGK